MEHDERHWHVIGVDPGFSGALARVRLDAQGFETLTETLRMPVEKTRWGRLVAVHELARWLRDHPARVAVLEHAQAMPKQGASSGYNYGRAVGALEAAVRLAGPERIEWVTPRQWKRALGLSASKREALALASLRYGEAARAPHWPVVAASGAAEAALIAGWWLDRRPRPDG